MDQEFLHPLDSCLVQQPVDPGAAVLDKQVSQIVLAHADMPRDFPSTRDSRVVFADKMPGAVHMSFRGGRRIFMRGQRAKLEQSGEKGGDAEVEFHPAALIGADLRQMQKFGSHKAVGPLRPGAVRRDVECFGQPFLGGSDVEADISSGRGHSLVMPEAGRIDHRSMRLEYDLPPVFKRRHPGAARMMDQLHHGMRVHWKVSARATPPSAHKTQRALSEQGDGLLRAAGKWGVGRGFHALQRSDAIFHNNRKVEEIADFWPLSDCQKPPCWWGYENFCECRPL